MWADLFDKLAEAVNGLEEWADEVADTEDRSEALKLLEECRRVGFLAHGIAGRLGIELKG